VITEKHIQTKAETFTVEGYNNLFRYFLARMRRKTKCCSKKVEIMHYQNNILSIFNYQ
jgi:insertion element IS1 protein InsB